MVDDVRAEYKTFSFLTTVLSRSDFKLVTDVIVPKMEVVASDNLTGTVLYLVIPL